MSRLTLKKFRVTQPAPDHIAKYIKKYTGSELFHSIDDLPLHSSMYLFDDDKPLVLDLGCGRGEFITSQAKNNPELNFVGLDVHQKSIWDGVNKAVNQELENIRFILADMRGILPKFADTSAQTIYLLFPPPHLQRKRLKKDVLTPELLKEVYRILRPAGEFVFVTDKEEYFVCKRKLINEYGYFREAEISQGFEGGITRFQKFWEKYGIPSSRVRYVKQQSAENLSAE